ncbi:MAG: hypothetical protein D3923_04820 [Candidatus Electrothrix sp. AR3]|nr:hypothetical protein [Candidatus Electrothrix sp. AR3]
MRYILQVRAEFLPAPQRLVFFTLTTIFSLFKYLSVQLFEDVNKRVSRLGANIPLIRKRCPNRYP